MGADIVLASDVAIVNKKAEITTVYDVIMQSLDIMQTEIGTVKEGESDLMLRPHMEEFSARSFKNIKDIIKRGEEETLRQLPKIKQLIKEH